MDLSGLTMGQSVHATDVKLPEGIKLVRHGSLNPVIVTATAPKPEVEIVAAPVAAPAKGKDAKKKK